ncbi:BTAD domain-containing putative transcriptional regulator [Nonomuraea antimicrobica]
MGQRGNPVRVPEAKVRALLTDLLVHEGRPVTADRLIDDLWGEDLPGNPANTLQVKISQLRRALGRDRVVHESAGYRLRLDQPTDEVDAERFQSLVTEARSAGDARARAELLTQALGLWRGPAYADVEDEEFARAAAQRLTEQRLAVLEEQAECRLELGDHILLIGELADLVARYPLRERLRAIQLRALYLAGRQSEALASYAELRELLTDELGLDPSPELAALQGAILRQDASLALVQQAETPAGPSGPEAPAEAATAAGRIVCPRSNLPATLSALIGREQSLNEVGDLLDRARLVTLTGPGEWARPGSRWRPRRGSPRKLTGDARRSVAGRVRSATWRSGRPHAGGRHRTRDQGRRALGDAWMGWAVGADRPARGRSARTQDPARSGQLRTCHRGGGRTRRAVAGRRTRSARSGHQSRAARPDR